LEGAIPISQQHTHRAAVAIVLRALIGHGQIEVPISVEVANRNRKGVHAPGKIGFWIEKHWGAI
jgi:hypothetical protein